MRSEDEKTSDDFRGLSRKKLLEKSRELSVSKKTKKKSRKKAFFSLFCENNYCLA